MNCVGATGVPNTCVQCQLNALDNTIVDCTCDTANGEVLIDGVCKCCTTLFG